MARIQFEIPDDRLEEMNRLQKKLGLSTRKDLFNNAMTLLEWAVEQKESGYQIASVDETNERYRELLMPALQSVRPLQTADR